MANFKYDKSVTSRDVAKLAGVSQSTVSRVFGNGNVKSEAKEKVLRAAEELGYRPNFMARSMIRGQTNIIGVVVGEGMGPFYHAILNELIDQVQAAGKQCLMFRVTKRDNIDNIVLKVLQFQVEAIVITAPAIKKDIQQISISSDVPIILFNRYIEQPDVGMVYVDPVMGAQMAAEYLCRLGHKKIGYVCYQNDTREEVEKRIGFSSVLQKNNIFYMQCEQTDYSYEAGYEMGKRLLGKSKEQRPSAVFCTSDVVALGLMDAARQELGLKIPEELSVIGYDDIPMARWKAYDLTTVRQEYGRLVTQTLELIIHFQEMRKKGIVRRIEPKLIIRNSASPYIEKENEDI